MALGLLTVSLAPITIAEHCETRIVVYGRPAFVPGILPPSSPADPICVDIESSISLGHLITPGSDQIFVRVEADLGGSYTRLKLTLSGLGWDAQDFTLYRTAGVTGSHTYNLEDWLTIPDPHAPGGDLRATVRFPGAHDATVKYMLIPV